MTRHSSFFIMEKVQDCPEHNYTLIISLAVFLLLQTSMFVPLTLWQRDTMAYYQQKVDEYKQIARGLDILCTEEKIARKPVSR